MTIRGFFIISFLLLMQNIYSQSSTIKGVVLIDGTSESVSDAYIFIEGSSYYDITNANGEFSINNVKSGKYSIRTSILGYQEYSSQIEINNGQDVILNINIKEMINNLPLVQINAQSGTGGALGALDSPGSSHFISKKELTKLNSTNIHEILQFIPGIQLQEEDGFGLRPNIGLRGTGSERSSKITILEDGILAAPAPYAAPSAYYFPTVSRMEAIEILKGASQIKYGPFTTGGVINFISTTIPNEFSGNLNMGFGNFGMRKIHANVGDKLNGFSYILEGAQILSTGFKNILNSNKNTGFDKKDWLVKLKYETKANSKIYQSVQLKYAETTEHSNETYLGLTKFDFDSAPYQRYLASENDAMDTKHRQTSLHYLLNPLTNLYFQTTIYFNSFSRNWYKLDKVQNQEGEKTNIASILSSPDNYNQEYSLLNGRTSLEQEALYIKANNRNYYSEGIQSKINYSIENQDVEFGFRIHYDQMDRFQWEDKYGMIDQNLMLMTTGIPGTESNLIESALAYSSYAKYSIKHNKLGLDIGIRNENISLQRLDYGKNDTERIGTQRSTRENDVNVWIPGASLKYEINSSQQIFSGIHRGFSPPGSKPDTKPELSVNYELGYKIQQNALFGSFVLFRNNYSNLLGADFTSSGGTGQGGFFNGGASVAQGVELGIAYRKIILENYYVPINIQYTYTDAKFLSNFESDFEPWGTVSKGDLIPYLSSNTFNIRTGINGRKVSFNVTSNFIGEMKTTAEPKQIVNSENIEARWIHNFDCSYLITKRTTLQFAIHNLTNKVYSVANRPAGWRPGAPRNISLSLNHHF